MSFKSIFPTNNNMNYGINDSQLKTIADDIRKNGKKDMLVIVEIDKNNNHAITNIELVRGNWFSRTGTRIARFFEGLSNGKTYHFGKSAAIQDLSAHMDALKEKYIELEKANPKDLNEVQVILENDTKFNSTINKVYLLASELATKPSEIHQKTESLYFHHDLALPHLKIIINAQDINESIKDSESGSPIDYNKEIKGIFQARHDLFSWKINCREDRQEIIDSTIDAVEQDLLKRQFTENLVQLSLNNNNNNNNNNNIDISDLIKDIHPDDPLKNQLEQLQSLKSLSSNLEVLENRDTNNLDYLQAGIQFVEEFYALDQIIQNESGLKERFNEIKFDDRAGDIIQKIGEEIQSFEADTENVEAFSQKYEEFVSIMEQLKKAKSAIKNEKLETVQECLDSLTASMQEKLSSTKQDQLNNLREKYKAESKSIENDLDKLTKSQKELEQALTSAQSQVLFHQNLVDSIRSGDPTDIAKLLTIPLQENVAPEVKNLVLALQAIVKQVRLEQRDIEYQEARLSELSHLLKAANLPEMQIGISAIDYLNLTIVAKNVGRSLSYADQKRTQAKQKVSQHEISAKSARREANLTKNQLILQKKKELEQIALVEIRLLRKTLGMTELRAHNKRETDQELTLTTHEILRSISPGELDEKEAEKQAEKKLHLLIRSFGGFYEQRDHLSSIAEKTLADYESSNLDTKFQGALYAITHDIIERRDALVKEIKEFEALQNPDFYTLEIHDLMTMLKGYQKKYKLPHLQIRAQDIISRAEMIQSSGQDATLISSEMNTMLELSAAYKYRSSLDDQAALRERTAEKASVSLIGWEKLFEGVDHLSKTQASYVGSEEAALRSQALKSGVKETQSQIQALEARRAIIKENKSALKSALEVQTELIGAEAYRAMMQHITPYLELSKK